MAYRYDTTRRQESELFPGVVFFMHKMTEGRRLELRSMLAAANRRIREILREQALIEKTDEDNRDTAKWLELNDEFDGIMMEQMNPVWIKWGLKKIEGLENDRDEPLTVEQWKEWPSALVNEVVQAIKAEAELNGQERKNSGSPTTSGGQEELSPKSSTAQPASGEDTGKDEIAHAISPVV